MRRALRALQAPHGHDRISRDVLDFPTEQPEHLFDFVFDHGFLNALDHRIHDDYGKKIGELVKENGIVITILYPVMDKEGGPPFAVSIERVKRIFMSNAFKPLQLEPLPPHLCMPRQRRQWQQGP